MVVDNEIRWTELCMLRDDWEEQQKSKTHPNENGERRGSSAVEQDLLTKHSYRVWAPNIDYLPNNLMTKITGAQSQCE